MKTIVGHEPSFFIGREGFLQELHTRLQSKRRVAISAPAGMGKTAVAAEYARRFADAYERIFYFNLASAASWLADNLELAERLVLPIAAKEQNLATISQALQDWLAQHPNTLLIIDNVGDIALPQTPELPACYTLLLTRKTAIDASIAHIHLATLEAEKGALLLLRQSGHLAADVALEQADAQSRAIAITLASAMDGLPLALTLAGAYIRTTRSRLPEFLATYQDYAARLVRLKVAKNSAIDAIAITCSLPSLYIKKTLPLATELLRLCVVLAPIDIPRALFLQGASELTPALQKLAQNPALLDEALTLLESLNLLVVDRATGLLSMQMTVQETLCQAQQPENRNSLVTRALQAFSYLLAAQEQARPATRMRVVAHILHLANESSEWIIPSEAVANTFSWAASLLWEQRLVQDAELLLRKALMIWERILGSGHETVSVATRNLGTLNALLKNYTEAETLLQNAMLARSRALGASHPDVLLCLLDLASIYAEQDKRDETRACYLEVLKIGESALDQEHPLLVVAAHKLAILAAEEEEFEEAEAYYWRILPIYEVTLGMEDNTTLECFEQMVTILLQQQKFAQAEEILQRLLAAKEPGMGIGHPYIRALLQKRAEVAVLQEKFASAEDIYQRLWAYCESAPDQDDVEIRRYLQQLGLLYLQEGKVAEAENAFRRLSQASA